MINICEITKKYSNTKALDEISLSIKEGDIIGLVGPNGAGKTTLLSIISKEISPTSGTMKVNTNDVSIAHQNYGLYDFLTVKEHLLYFSGLKKIQNKKDRINSIMDIFGLNEFTQKKIMWLSEGQKKRMQLALTFLANNSLYILDEPTVGLDPEWRENVIGYIRELNNTENNTILYSTHYLSEIEQLCNKIILLNNGNLVFYDSLINIIKSIPYNLKIRVNLSQNENFNADLISEFIKKGPDSYDYLVVYTSNEYINNVTDILNQKNVFYEVNKIDIEDIFFQQKTYVHETVLSN